MALIHTFSAIGCQEVLLFGSFLPCMVYLTIQSKVKIILYGTSHTNLLSADLEPIMYPQNKGGTTKTYRHMYGCLTTFVTQIATGMGKLAGTPITTENTGLESYGL